MLILNVVVVTILLSFLPNHQAFSKNFEEPAFVQANPTQISRNPSRFETASQRRPNVRRVLNLDEAALPHQRNGNQAEGDQTAAENAGSLSSEELNRRTNQFLLELEASLAISHVSEMLALSPELSNTSDEGTDQESAEENL